MTTSFAPLRRLAATALALAAALGLAACGQGATDTGSALVRVELAPGTIQVARGAAVGLTATAIWQSAAPTDVGAEAAWSSSAPAVAEVAGGRVVGRALGTAVVTAAWSGKSATALVTVTPAALVAVQVDPGAAFLAAGTTRRFAATGVYTDGTTADLTEAAAWSVEGAAAALPAGTAPGTLRGAAPGTATLTATAQGLAGHAAVTVGAPVLDAIRVEPATAQVPVGLDQPFTATGLYSDGTTADLTAEVLWSADGALAAFPSANAGRAHGLAVGGPVRVQAMLPGAGAVGEASLTVTAATVVSVDVTPAAATLPRGLTRALAATAVFSDGHHADVTAQVTWSSADPARVGVSSAPATAGTVSAVAVGGPVAVTATLAAAGVSGRADVTVTAAAVASVEVSPAAATVPAGRTLAFTAAAVLTDGTRQPATEAVAWQSADPGLATLSNVDGARGLATGLRTGGPVTVRATLPGLAAPGEASLTVSGAELTALTVEPAALALAAGTGAQLRATGRYSDGTVADLTGLVAWQSADPAVADVQAGPLAAGRLLGVAAGGPVTVTARLPGAALTGAAAVTVTPAVLVSLAVSPAGARAPLGRGVAFTATGTFSDGSTQDLTRQVSWLSGDDAVATVSNAYEAAGFAQSRAEGGPVEIRAWFPGTAVSAAGAFTVDPPALVSLAVAPDAVALPAGRTQQLRALGTFTDAVVRDLTAAATWTSAAPASVAPLAAPGAFRAAAVTAAPVAVTAAVAGQQAACAFTVLPPVVDRLDVAPPVLSLEWGASARVIATATWSDATATDVSALAEWSAAVPGVVRFAVAGGEARVAGAWLGTTAIAATYQGVAGAGQVSVTPALPASLRVVPGQVALGVNGAAALRALGTYADGTVLDVTAAAAWSVSPPGAVALTGAGAVHGLAPGQATVTATLGASATAAVVVTAQPPLPSLVSLAVEGASPALAIGGAAQLRATGWRDDGSQVDLTGQVAWASDAPAVVAVDAAGVARGLALGTARVSATHAASGLAAAAAVEVAGVPEIASLTLEGPARVPADAPVQLRAVGHTAAGGTVDLTAEVAWVPVAGATPLPGPGRYQAQAPGLRVAAFWKALQAELAIPVSAAAASLRAVPGALQLRAGGRGYLQVVARYPGADPEEAGIAPDACTSSAPAVVSCEGPVDTPFGQVFVPSFLGCDAGSLGTATVTCTWGALEVQLPVTVSPSAPVEVVTDVFVRPAGWLQQWGFEALQAQAPPLLSPASWPTLTPGASTALELIAVTSGGQVQEAQADAWASTDPRVGAVDATGRATARAPGAFAALATLGDASGFARLTVLGATVPPGLVVVGPAAPVDAGTTVALGALAGGPEGTDLTAEVAWSSSDAAVAAFDAAAPGRLQTRAAGTVTVTATARDGRSATREVHVSGVAALRVVPAHLDLPIQQLFGLGAIARRSDGRPFLANGQVEWTVLDPGIVEPFDQLNPGSFMAISTGATQVRADYAGLTATADVVVDGGGQPVLDAVGIYDVPVLLVGQAGGVQAVAAWTDGELRFVGPGWTVTTSDPSLVAVQDGAGQPVAAGTTVLETASLTVVGLAEGLATLTVTEPTGTLSDSAPIYVTRVQSLVIRPGVATADRGDQVAFTAYGVDGLGREVPVAADWTLDDGQVAVLLEPGMGLVEALDVGGVTVTAQALGFTATARLEVVEPTAYALYVDPAQVDLELGQAVQLAATGNLPGDLTATVAWHALDPQVAGFRDPAAPGRLTAAGVGQTAAVATVEAGGRTLAATSRVTVHAALQSLDLQIASTVLGAGAAYQVAAIANWGDGSAPTDATRWVTWSSSDPTVVAPPTQGADFVTALTPGTATLTATAPSGVRAQVELTVVPPFPVQLELVQDGGFAPIPVGAAAAFLATAIFSDGTVGDVTQAATWTTDGPAGTVTGPGLVRVDDYPFGPIFVTATVATPAGPLSQAIPLEVIAPVEAVEVFVDPPEATSGEAVRVSAFARRLDGSGTDVTAEAALAFSPGVATPTGAPGEFRVTGRGPQEVRATFEGVTGLATLFLQPRPVSLAIAPSPVVVVEGDFASFAATVTFDDGATADVTFESQWLADGVVSVVTGAGQLFGLAPGQGEVVATWFGPLGPLEARAPVTVRPAPSFLVVTPDPASIGVGSEAAFTATAFFSDGSQRDVTGEAIWAVTIGGYPLGATPGTVAADLPGFGEVQAFWGPLSASASFQVFDVPRSLAITPAALALPAGSSVGVEILADMAFAGPTDVSASVAWTSDNPAVAEGFFSVVGAHAAGTTTLHASYTSPRGDRVEAALVVTVFAP